MQRQLEDGLPTFNMILLATIWGGILLYAAIRSLL
jgi:hypothetical protein